MVTDITVMGIRIQIKNNNLYLSNYYQLSRQKKV
jgi:hypothetical protein